MSGHHRWDDIRSEFIRTPEDEARITDMNKQLETDLDIIGQEWEARKNNAIGGWCIQPVSDPRTVAEGGMEIGDFLTKDIAEHIAEIHNQWIEWDNSQRPDN